MNPECSSVMDYMPIPRNKAIVAAGTPADHKLAPEYSPTMDDKPMPSNKAMKWQGGLSSRPPSAQGASAPADVASRASLRAGIPHAHQHLGASQCPVSTADIAEIQAKDIARVSIPAC